MPAMVGAVAGSAARYVVPTKNELSSIINKDAVDTFVSNASAVARGSKRSILKYGGFGALIAAGIASVAKFFSAKNKLANTEYAKYEALLDTPADSAYAIMWYGD